MEKYIFIFLRYYKTRPRSPTSLSMTTEKQRINAAVTATNTKIRVYI